MIEFFKQNNYKKALKNLWKKSINRKSITVFYSYRIIIVFDSDSNDYIYPSTDEASAKRKIKEIEKQLEKLKK